MGKIMESLRRLRKVNTDKRYQESWNSLTQDEKLELVTYVVNQGVKA